MLDIREIEKVSDFDTRDNSYSPLFSSIGLRTGCKVNGLDELFLHYNRATRPIFSKLISFNENLNLQLSTVNKLVFGDNIASLSFYKNDAFIFEANLDSVDIIKEQSEETTNLWIVEECKRKLVVQGYSKNTDGRDPDENVGFILGIKAVSGVISNNAVKSENGKIRLVFAFQALEMSKDEIDNILDSAPESVDDAEKICKEWFEKYVGKIKLNTKTADENTIIHRAIQGLMFNATIGQGNLKNHISAYPSRGGYPTHFMWDTYFQNLAYEELSIDMAKEFLLQIADNQRSDGKIPQFMCSTWGRPHDSQPALLGWNVRRILKADKDIDFAKRMLYVFEKNNNWFLTQRMTKFGVISCPSGLETGQDDSPRFDNGPTLATDMNSYLLDQINVTAEIADMLGLEDKKVKWEKEAEKLSENMIRVLYNEEDNLFYDADIKTGKQIKIVSPTAILPIWAKIKIGDKKIKDMIEKYLINPEYLFGEVPFPSIAYNQDCYMPEKWWRGPTWMPIAWLMLETLENNGYSKEYDIAAKRLYNTILEDMECHELFNSKTKEGMGCTQQGWTCAIFIKLCLYVNR